jgi:hypothetical protein
MTVSEGHIDTCHIQFCISLSNTKPNLVMCAEQLAITYYACILWLPHLHIALTVARICATRFRLVGIDLATHSAAIQARCLVRCAVVKQLRTTVMSIVAVLLCSATVCITAPVRASHVVIASEAV